MGYKERAIKSVSVLIIATFFNRLVRFFTKLVLARVLLPADFGIIALGIMVYETLNLSRLGVDKALIFRGGDARKAANTAFILEIATGLLFYLAAYFSAPLLAVFFNEPSLVGVIRLLALMFILYSLSNIPSALLEKRLDFKKIMLADVISVVSYSISSIGLAYQGFGYWSLVYGYMVSAVFYVGVFLVISPWRPSIEFKVEIAKELLGYGKHILGASVVFFLVSNIDKAVVAKLMDMESLGIYSMAYWIATLPVTNIAFMVGQVLFPIYSTLEEKEALVRIYFKAFEHVCFVTVPLAFIIFLFIQEGVVLFLSDRWTPMVGIVKILSFYGIVMSIGVMTDEVLRALGKPGLVTKYRMIQLLILAVGVVPAALFFGSSGVALLVLLSSVSVFLELGGLSKILGFRIRDLAFLLWPCVLAAATSSILVVIIRPLAPKGFTAFMLELIIFTGMYFTFFYMIDKKRLTDFMGLFEYLRQEGGK